MTIAEIRELELERKRIKIRLCEMDEKIRIAERDYCKSKMKEMKQQGTVIIPDGYDYAGEQAIPISIEPDHLLPGKVRFVVTATPVLGESETVRWFMGDR